MSALTALLESLQTDSEGSLVLISGEAGVGKTSLLRRFCELQSESDPGPVGRV